VIALLVAVAIAFMLSILGTPLLIRILQRRGIGQLIFAAFVIIAFWQFRHPGIYHILPAASLDLAVIAGAMFGACAGFLWWNAAPARVFMGDVGALAIGGAMAGLALLSHTVLLLPILGGLYVVEFMSVIAQVVSFRIFHRRVLRMAPIHHHFEVGGWPESTVVVRFWLLAGLAVAVGLGIFYADFINIPGVLD
jgi:phospho-N-acetylmuramoyl-pentapeptide-transferase